jgi:hypothetical protein
MNRPRCLHQPPIEPKFGWARLCIVMPFPWSTPCNSSALCRLAVRLAHHRCPPPLPTGPGGAPRTYSEESLLLIALLRTRLPDARIKIGTTGSPVGQRWLWPVASPWEKMDRSAFEVKSQQWKRRHAAGAPLHESLFVLTVLHALRARLIGARDLIIDSAPAPFLETCRS